MAGNRDVFDQAMKRGHSAAWDLQWEKALAYYRAALTEFPDDPNALTSLGFAMLQSEKPEDALKIYQRAASLAPGDPVAPEKCGEIFEQLGRLNDAAQTYMAVAEIHLTRRDVPKAVDNWNRVVRLTPDNLNAHSRLALAYERGNQPQLAAMEYLEVARIFQRGSDLARATQAATRAQQILPSSAEVREAFDKLRRGVPLPVPTRPAAGRRQPGGTGMLSPSALAALEAQPAPTSALASPGGLLASPLAAAKDAALEHLAEMLFDEDADTTKTAGSISFLSKGTGPLRGGKANRAQAIMYLGQAISQTAGEPEAALTNYGNALSAGLDSPLVRFMIGALSLELDRPAEAPEYLAAAASRDDVGLGATFGLGEACRRQGQLREAFKYLMDALKRLDLQSMPAGRQDALSEAYESVDETVSRASDSDLEKLVNSLAQFLSGEGWEQRLKQARQQLDAAAEDGQVGALADLFATPGTDRAMESLRRLEQYVKAGLYATAMEEAFYAIEFSPTYLPIHIRMAEILLAENKPEAAFAKYAVIAESYRVRNEFGRAARIMKEVLRLSPLDVNARTRLIDMLLDQGRLEDALDEYISLADTYYQLADLDTARETYTDALRVADDNRLDTRWHVRILHQLADIDMQRLGWREALREYEQIASHKPDDEKARKMLVDLNFRLGDARAAVTELDAFLKQLLAARNPAPALKVLEELVVEYPDETAVLARLARLYKDIGRKADAIVQYDRLGEMQLNAGQNAQAIETIRAIIALGPDDPTPYQELLTQLQAS